MICGVLPNGVPTSVVDQELDPVDALAADRVDLVEENAAEGLVCHPEHGSFAVFHFKIVGGIVQFESLAGFDLNGVVRAVFQGKEGQAVLICRDGVDQLIVDLPDLKGDVGDALFSIRGVDLNDLHPSDRVVQDGDSLRIAGVDHNSLAARFLMDSVAVNGCDLGDDKGTHQAIEHDLAVFIGAVEAHAGRCAAVAVYHGAVGFRDLELHALQWLPGDGVELMDYKAT